MIFGVFEGLTEEEGMVEREERRSAARDSLEL